jgi:NAD(P)-dependent dehydrogenase (short-subunit alcohol dehydrogenase family)
VASEGEPVPGRDLTGRTALITGGGSGLGRAVSLRLARGGAHVVVADVREDHAEHTCRLVADSGRTATAVGLDVTDSAQVNDTVRGLFDRFGDSLDCLVNNAGTDRGAGLLDITDEQWDRVVAVNQSAPMYMTRAFLQCSMSLGERQFPADVVNVISISAITVGADAAAYNSSKAALAKLTQVMQREAHEYRWPARIHGLMPSAMNTPMMEQWHLSDEVMMAPDTVARAVEFMITLPPDTFVQNLVITSRREPGWPR